MEIFGIHEDTVFAKRLPLLSTMTIKKGNKWWKTMANNCGNWLIGHDVSGPCGC